MAYLLISIILPASLIFVFSTVILELSKKLILSSNPFNLQVVLALFGRSLGVRRLYVRVLLAIFQVSVYQCFFLIISNFKMKNSEEFCGTCFIWKSLVFHYILFYLCQYARRVARQHARKHQRNFTIGCEGEETEGEGGCWLFPS